MTIPEALEVVRGELFGAGTMSRGYMARVDAMRVIAPILEAAAKITPFDLTTEDWPSAELHDAIEAAKEPT